ncbi:hypothetical protein MTO96_027498 [Rhipicephalus appendiculatus]
MGNALHRDTQDNATGLSEKERRLIHESWQTFTKKHPDYGIILFTALFVKHPEYQKLFKKFKGKDLGTLMRDPVFTDHASSAGRQITAMVNALETPGVLLEIITKNIEFHPIGSGVLPEHYVEMGRALIDVLRADEDEHTTRATIRAWEKLLHLMNQKTTEVYAEEVKQNKLTSADPFEVERGMSTTDIMAGSNKSVEQVGHKQLPSAGPHHQKASDSQSSSKKEHPKEAASHDKVGVEHGAASGSTEQATTSGKPPKDKPETHSHLHASEGEHPKEAASHDKVAVEHGAAGGSTEPATASGMPPKDKTEKHSHLHASEKEHPKDATSRDKKGAEHDDASGSAEQAATSGMGPKDKSETISRLHVTERSALKTHRKDHLGHKPPVPPLGRVIVTSADVSSLREPYKGTLSSQSSRSSPSMWKSALARRHERARLYSVLRTEQPVTMKPSESVAGQALEHVLAACKILIAPNVIR